MKETKGIEVTLPFPRMSYDDAMNNYGSDKPDTRFDMLLQDLTELVKDVDFKVFAEAPAVKAIVVKGNADKYSRKSIDKLTDFAKQFGAKGLAWVKMTDGVLAGPVAKFLTSIEEKLTDALQIEENDLVLLRAVAYDIVLNGYELGGGSLRINQKDLQERMLKALGFSEESAYEQFGFLLEAMDYGFPPHGGLALGLDRFVMLLAGKDNIREVIAFPKNNKASDPMTQAPSLVADKQLEELALHVELENE